jgi:hypothetical protein
MKPYTSEEHELMSKQEYEYMLEALPPRRWEDDTFMVAELFREEIRASLTEIIDEQHSQRSELKDIIADLAQMREGLAHASQLAPTSGQFSEMTIKSIIMTYDDKGKQTYKATGAPFIKFGVRVWPETLPILGIFPLTLKPGPNVIEPIRARVQMHETKDDSGNPRQSPQKVTGRA